ncbi:uncharacterized protein TRAVEDRAFT_50871 [Trametes versicolor FP-101664 SS1]|uniref:uncharacterized protein n=1 Tax=Trametes versicolor (strain FP-101664) TaxID=717944 RepID=UPI00046237EA|nr:uncharacterized protein TRAVEDRAFT_50871 [Trametes versicolor FP-101664 SS1]EIW54730.1 hypothetical protein TRAVEDRAFT_50871 [Trametes versicolor FP-101664 SS1]
MAAMSKLLNLPPGLARPATRTPVKRALIIGINYASATRADKAKPKAGELQCAHRDARIWRDLLLDTYDYRNEDITLMLDAPDMPVDLRPTKMNILRQISRLVQGLESGDRIVFFYAGHSRQLESKSVNEEDGFDEALVPVDHSSENDCLIIDNVLRRKLVDPLSAGVSLTAIFDSCHSGTLLDMDHYLCNGIYFPWLSRGKRKSKPKLQGVVRRNARVVTKPNVKMTSLTPEDAAKIDIAVPGETRGRADLRVYGRERTPKGKVLKFDTAIDKVESNEKGEKRFVLTRSSSMQVKRDKPFPGIKATIQRCYSFDYKYRTLKRDGSWFTKARKDSPAHFWSDKERCSSPEPIGRRCDGWCQVESEPEVHVVSISACQDLQVTYETRDGKSMTTDLVELLRSDPYPRCRELVQQLGHKLHGTILLVHQASKEQHDKAKKKKTNVKRLLDGDNFSEPQIGSQHTLVSVKLVPA